MRAHAHSSAVGFVVAFLIAAVVAAGADVASGQRTTVSATGTLELRATLRFFSEAGMCPLGVTASFCAARTGEGLVPGLGSVTEAYTFLADISGSPPCAAGLAKALGYPARFVVAGKGEIYFTLAEGSPCVEQQTVPAQTQAFTITGGTGIYVGASGSGTVARVLGAVSAMGRFGRETWTGTLIAPGLEFDITPPTVTGAVAKTVRAPRGAKRARVVYAVSARDEVDGAVPVLCIPRSGSRFAIGRTRVTCSATDTSGNSRTARFTITVRPQR
jgi:hypothetical protein